MVPAQGSEFVDVATCEAVCSKPDLVCGCATNLKAVKHRTQTNRWGDFKLLNIVNKSRIFPAMIDRIIAPMATFGIWLEWLPILRDLK